MLAEYGEWMRERSSTCRCGPHVIYPNVKIMRYRRMIRNRGRIYKMGAATVLHLQGIVDVFEQSGDMHMITDCAGVIKYVNPVFESITGFAKDEVIGKAPLMLKSGSRPDEFYAAMWEPLISGKAFSGKIFKGVLVNRKRSGVIFYEDTSINTIPE